MCGAGEPRHSPMPEPSARLGFWGVRGSTPTVDRDTVRYGGNTPCLELLAPDGTRFMLDCGTGMRMLGRVWMNSYGVLPADVHVFVTHYHWDHIQGIPFFAPLYSEQNRFHFYSFLSPLLGRNSLRQVLETQMANPFFPVDTSAMTASREFTDITDGDRIDIRGTRITARWLNHPQGCLGFRLETSAGTIVYATDNEPGHAEFDSNLRELAAGADIFINDAQFTPEQIAGSRKGWGHSSWLDGVKIAREVGAKHLVLFHHDPDSSDRDVDTLLGLARQQFQSVWAATEKMVMTLSGGKLEVTLPHRRGGQRRRAFLAASVQGYSEQGGAFEEHTILRDLGLQGAYLDLEHRPRLQSELVVTMVVPGMDDKPEQKLQFRGYVVRAEPGPEPHLTTVGILFTDEESPADILRK